MQTIVELPEFQRRSDKLLSSSERLSVINYLAAHPLAGDLMQGTGGIRKLRWAAKGKGKSGGVRIIYYFHNTSIPLFLLTLFGKGEKSFPRTVFILSPPQILSLKMGLNFRGYSLLIVSVFCTNIIFLREKPEVILNSINEILHIVFDSDQLFSRIQRNY